MLKYGIKRRRTEFEPESTKAEKLKKELDAMNDTAPTAEKETIKEDERKSEEGDVTNVSQENSVKKVKKEEDEE
ncbi:hypothetical protein AGDE_12755 [Angomonas deanei]|nr:hypothetical protein AGDE_12755 [Angomonas deanei]|eukprot:EPY23833.1 hypothetical protein AGDE_12755 [Angomonas deanei]